MLSLRHCTVAIVLALGAVLPADAQTTAVPAPATGDSSLTIFIRGVEVGRMQSTVSHADTSWVISSTGRFGDIVLNRLEIKYDADWQPTSLRVEATQVQKRLVLSHIVRADDRHQRDFAGRRHDRQDRPDLGAHRRAPQQLLREL